MKKRLLTVLVTGTILTLGALTPNVSAQDFDSQINSVNSTIANINDKKAAVNATIDSLVSELSGVQTKIDATQAQKAEAQAAIDSLKSEISKFVPSLLVAPLPGAKYNVCLFCSNFKAIAYSLPPLPIIKIFKNSP